MENDAIRQKLGSNDRNSVRVFVREQRTDIDQRDLGPETRKSLRQFAADDTAADHEKMVGALCKIEDRFVCQVRQVGKPRNWRNGRFGTRGNHKAPCRYMAVAEHQRFVIDKARLGKNDLDAERSKTLGRIMWLDCRYR